MRNTLSAPAAIRAIGPLSAARCRRAGSSSSAAARNVTKSPGVALRLAHLPQRDRHHDRDPDGAHDLRHRRRRRPRDLHPHREPAQLGVDVAEALVLVGAAVVHLDHALALVRLLDRARHLAEHHLVLDVQPAQPAAEAPQHQRDDRRDDQRHQRQLPVVVDQHGEQADHDQRVAHGGAEHLGGQVQRVGRLVDELRDHDARRHVLERRRRPAQHALEHRRAQFDQHALRDPVQQVRAGERREAADDEQADERGRQPQRRRAALEQRAVGHDARELGQQRIGDGRDRGRDEREPEHLALHEHHPHQAAQVRIVEQAGMGRGCHEVACHNPGPRARARCGARSVCDRFLELPP